MTFSCIVNKISNKNWYLGAMIPTVQVQSFLDAGISRFICTLNGVHSFPCALLSDGKGGRYILLNAEIRKKFALAEGSQVSIELKEDKSEYGMPVPEELSILWEQDELFKQYFDALTPGKQRNIIYYVGKFKSEEKRIQKAVQFAKHLELGEGALDFRLMNQQVKEKII